MLNEETTILGQNNKNEKPKFKIVKEHVQGLVAVILLTLMLILALTACQENESTSETPVPSID